MPQCEGIIHRFAESERRCHCGAVTVPAARQRDHRTSKSKPSRKPAQRAASPYAGEVPETQTIAKNLRMVKGGQNQWGPNFIELLFEQA